MALINGTQRYYPQQKDPRLNEDLRVVYDHVYRMQDHISALTSRLQKSEAGLQEAHGKIASMSAASNPGGPSSTKIAGLNVEGIPPANGATVTNLSGLPVLVYDAKTSQITWKIPS